MKMKMHINSPDPEYLGKKLTDRYFQLPQWGIKSDIFAELTQNELKLYIFFVSKSDKYTRETPAYAVSDLAARCRINRKYIRQTVLSLAARALIRAFQKGVRIKALIMFDPPHGLYDELAQRKNASLQPSGKAFLNSSPLKAKVLNRRSHRRAGCKMSQNLGHNAPESGTFRDMTCDKMGQPPNWITETERIKLRHYEPGADREEI